MDARGVNAGIEAALYPTPGPSWTAGVPTGAVETAMSSTILRTKPKHRRGRRRSKRLSAIPLRTPRAQNRISTQGNLRLCRIHA
ncbi:MAG: hypothetical protein ACK528_02640, partial [Alphaproteobacteria bacterium]